MRVFVAGATAAVGKRLLTEIRDASNAKAKRELERPPRHPSRPQGFAA